MTTRASGVATEQVSAMVTGMTTTFGGPTEPYPCPWGHCAARLLLITHRIDPADVTKIAIVYPMHDVEGENSWFGRCPASQLSIVPGPTIAGQRVLAAADRQIERMIRERAEAAAARHARVSEIAHDMIDNPAKYPPPKPRPEPPSAEDYFPGRPADAPEPGVGDAPAKPVPLDQPGQFLGRAEEMSTRDTHLAMIVAARTSIGEAQDHAAACFALLEQLEGAIGTLPPSVTAAHGLVHAAVGGDATLPEPAANMRANVTAALDTVTGDGSIAQAVGLVRARLAALAGQLASASENATAYAAMPK